MTDLFTAPNPQPALLPDGTQAGVLDTNLVHVTRRGVLVRSRNEGILAGMLDEHLGMLDNPDYQAGWERKKDGTGGTVSCRTRTAAVRPAPLVWTDESAGTDVPAWTALAQSGLGASAPAPDAAPAFTVPAKKAVKKATPRPPR